MNDSDPGAVKAAKIGLAGALISALIAALVTLVVTFGGPAAKGSFGDKSGAATSDSSSQPTTTTHQQTSVSTAPSTSVAVPEGTSLLEVADVSNLSGRFTSGASIVGGKREQKTLFSGECSLRGTYEIGGKYRRFVAVAAMSDATADSLKVPVKVVIDGAVFPPLTVYKGHTEQIDIDISGVQVLEITAQIGGCMTQRDNQFVLINPVLVP